MGKKILHIGLIIYLLFIGISSYSQQVNILAPSSVCRGKVFSFTIHSNVPISFELQKSNSPYTNWVGQGQFQTEGSGVDYNFTYSTAITSTTRYRIWYTTDLFFDPANPNFANPSPVYYPQNTDPQVEITLYPTPLVSSFTASATCSGAPFTVTPSPTDGSGNAVSAMYTWLQPVVTGGLMGGTSSNIPSATISGTLTNPTTSIQSATFTVTPISSVGGCAGAPFTVTVPINPTPQINNQQETKCSGDQFTITPTDITDGVVPTGTNYAWNVPTLTGAVGAITGGASGSGFSIVGTLVNTTNYTQTATYTVIPSLASGCTGSSFTVTVTLKPRPNIADNNPPQICSGNAFIFTPLITDIVPAGTKYTWTVGINTNVTGQSDVITPTSSFSQVLTGNSSTQALTYTVTPIIDGCAGPSFNSTVTIVANPLVNSVGFQICSGGGFSFTPINGRDGIVPANTRYTWSINNNINVTGQQANPTPSNSIFGSNLVNTTLTNQDVIYTVTSSVSNGCTATTFTVTATIVPKAIIGDKILNGANAICSGNLFSVTPGGAGDIVVPGTNYTWTVLTNSTTTGQSGVSTPTSPISQELTNLTNEAQQVIYNVTSVSNGTCAPATFTITVTVNPKPTIADNPITRCSGNGFDFDPSSVSGNIIPSGTIYAWGYTPNSNLTGQTVGTYTSTINNRITQGILTNISSATQTSTYAVTPKVASTGCTGAAFVIPLTVNPKPFIQDISAPTICSGGTMTISPTDGGGNIVPAGIKYAWDFGANNNFSGQSNNINQNSIFQPNLVNLTKDPQAINYTVTPSTVNCTGSTFTITQLVNPVATIASSTISTCSGESFTSSPALPNIIPDNTNYTWTIASSTVSGTLNQTNPQESISQLLTNNTSSQKSAVYLVTPLPQNGCTSSTFTLTVNVNPTPKIANKTITDICSSIGFVYTPTDGAGGDIVPSLTTYTWTTPPNLSVSGISSVTSTQINIAQVPINLTSSIQSLSYTVTATSNLGCAGSPFGLGMNIKPTATIGAKDAAPICSGNAFSVPLVDGQNNDIIPNLTKYTWTVIDNLQITGDINQSVAQNTMSQTLTSTSINPELVTYSVLPVLNNNCPANTFTVTAHVNPLPTTSILVTENSAFGMNDGTICSNELATFTARPVIGALSDYNYTWTVPVGAAPQGTGVSSFTSNVAGTYGLSIENISTSCVSATQTNTNIIVLVPPSAGDITGPNNVCVGSSIVLTTHPSGGSGNYLNYYWFENNSIVITDPFPYPFPSIQVRGIIASSPLISYKVQDDQGCYSDMSNNRILQINPLPSIPVVNSINQPYDGRLHTGSAAATNPSIESIEWYSNTSLSTPSVAPSATNYTPQPIPTSYAIARNNSTNCASSWAMVTVNITKKDLTLSANDGQETYSGLAYTSGYGISPNPGGFVNGETITSALSGTLTFTFSPQNPINVGTYAITPSGYSALNYNINYVDGVLTIDKKSLSITGVTVANKVYDGTDIANMSTGVLSGLIPSDVPNVILKRMARFPSKNVGNNLAITSYSTLEGNNSVINNYAFDPTITAFANITAKTIDASGFLTADKVYDATITANVTGGFFRTAIATGTGTSTDKTPYIGDQLVIQPSGYFADKNVANSIPIISTSSISGTDAGNYILETPVLTARNITPKNLFMTGLSVAATKIYDGTTNASILGAAQFLNAINPGTGSASDGLPFIGDNILFSGTPSANYNSKDVLTASTVQFAGLSIGGAQSNNYTLTMQSNSFATILPKRLTMSGLIVPASKVYDGTTNSVVSGSAILQTPINAGTGNISDGKPYIGDLVNISGTPVGQYNTKNTYATTVSFSGLSLSGNEASNYTLEIQANSASNITPLNRRVYAVAQFKKYGTVDPIFTYTHDPLVPGDVFAGVLTRDAGESIGQYLIQKGSLDLGINYTITYIENKLVINPADLYVRPNTVKRIYGDTPLSDGIETNDFATIGLQYGETLKTLKLYFEAGSYSGNNKKDSVGLYLNKVEARDLKTGTAVLTNYNIIYQLGNLQVDKYDLRIVAEDKLKRESEIDPPFTYQILNSLIEGDSLIGGLTREVGITPGLYQIQQGTLAVNNNYNYLYTPAYLTILTIKNVFVVPTAFTPNNDGLNDVLSILHNPNVASLIYFKIYNRAGNLVYQTNTLAGAWDGRVGGTVQDADAYYWTAEFTTWNNLNVKQKGTFLLIK